MPKIENKGNLKELKVLARNDSLKILCNMSRNPATPVCTIGFWKRYDSPSEDLVLKHKCDEDYLCQKLILQESVGVKIEENKI